MRDQAPLRGEKPPDVSPLMTKTEVAKYFKCSTRQVEIMVQKGRLPKPFYLGDSSPRWKRKFIDQLTDEMSREAQAQERNFEGENI